MRRKSSQWLTTALLMGALLMPIASQAAPAGDVEYRTGVIAYDKADYVEAARWFLEAAEQGHVIAQYNMGYLYQEGEGVPQDHAAAVEWYEKAAAQNYLSAMKNLASLYFYGTGVKQDDVKAAHWMLKAAEAGDLQSQYNMGILYLRGQGIAQNYGETLKWLLRAAEQGYPWAQNDLGIMYAKGQGVKKDYVEALKWMRLALKGLPEGEIRSQTEKDAAAIVAYLPPDEVTRAEKLATEWQAEFPPEDNHSWQGKPGRLSHETQ